ncbi:MAG: hypothetical protein KatS3mg076_0941 [Candidatus Binatia bacterium]|nr:MAG: hypothetical protein KatS3mg076_0941 [Candidatus Binatia bacterium]
MRSTAGASATRRRPGRPPGPSQAPELRRKLLEEALRLYAAGGYRGLSFSVLAERAGLQKPTVFHYFSNKDALLSAVFGALGDELEQRVLDAIEPPPASFAGRLERLTERLVDFYGREPVHARVLCHGLLEVERAPHLVGESAHPVFARFVRALLDFFAGGSRAGEFYPERPAALVSALGGLVLFEFMLPEHGRRIFGEEELGFPLERRKKEIVDFVRRVAVRPEARLRAVEARKRRNQR